MSLDTIGCPAGPLSIAAALARGGIRHQVTREELRALFRGLADTSPLTVDDQRSASVHRCSEEGLPAAAVREGIAVVSPDRPILRPGIEPTVRLAFLDRASESLCAGTVVDTLFLILSSTVAEHRAVMNGLNGLLDNDELRRLLATRPSAADLLDAVGRLEGRVAARL